MITVEKVWEGVREEGLNFGLPTTFIKLGEGTPYSSEELVREILMRTRCKWVCIQGRNTTQVGMGTLVKGLSSVGLYIEVECSGGIRSPGWLHAVDRWVVDYSVEGTFNYAALRSQDMIRFTVGDVEGDLEQTQRVFEDLAMFPGTKCIKVVGEVKGVFDLARKFERSRIYASPGGTSKL